MKLNVDPTVDIAFRKLFGTEENAPVLIDLLHAVVQPTRPITGLEMVRTHAEMDSPVAKSAIADIRARDQGNRQFQLEMQRQAPRYFPKRLLYYWARYHPEQLRSGENYQTLRPTITIGFVNQPIFPDVAEHHLVFDVREAKHGLVFSNDLELHLIELPKFTKTVEMLSSALDRWCYFLRHGAELDLEHLPASLDVPIIRRAMEVLAVFTQDERERAAYEARLKYELDQRSFMQEVEEARAFMREFRAAKEEARSAKERGVAMGQIHAYQEILKLTPTPETELAAMSQEDLAVLLAQLRKQLLPNGG